MIKVTEEIRRVARGSAERIVESGKDRADFGSSSVRTKERQVEDWTVGILGEMVFQKELQGIVDVGPVNLSVTDGGDGGTDFKIVVVDGQIRSLKVPLDIKTVRRGSWLLVPERGFIDRALYALVSVSGDEGQVEGMAFGWMFRDSEGLPYYRIVEGEGLPNAVDAGIQYWQGLRRHRTSLTREGLFPYIYESEFKLKTTNLGLPKQALLTDSYNWAWALEKASQ